MGQTMTKHLSHLKTKKQNRKYLIFYFALLRQHVELILVVLHIQAQRLVPLVLYIFLKQGDGKGGLD